MPRLLNTWTGEFEWHDPKEVRYAILSHVWQTPEEGGEQTFDDVRRIQADVKAAREEPGGPYPAHWPQAPIFEFDTMDEPFPNAPNEVFADPTLSDILYASLPDDSSVIFCAESPLSDKIKGLCKVARDAGFELAWNDTCCIDKSSSAELSEAINSMYEWYRLSDICYVYLADVPDSDGIPQAWSSFFRRSRWHKRGWTLQELIAPECIQFLTCSWRFLGTKLGLAGTVAEITGIDVNILLGRAPVDSASVAQRMSWAAERGTTRIEDRAYSLMGLFGVHMSPIYGEGTNAFLRLQEEMIRTIPDQSIFAWQLTSSERCDVTSSGLCLLASSPASFNYSTVRPTTPSEFASRLNLRGPEGVPPLDCTFAPQGARIQLLCVSLKEVRQLIPSLRQCHTRECVVSRSLRYEADKLALLQCENADGDLVGLAFHSSDVTGGGLGSHIGDRCTCHGIDRSFRTVRLPQEVLAEILEGFKPETAEVSLLRHRSVAPLSKSLLPHKSLPPLRLWRGDLPIRAAFILSPDSIANLRTLGFTVSPLQTTREEHKITLETTLALRYGDLLYSIQLRLSLEQPNSFASDVSFYLHSSATLSPEFSSSPTAVPGTRIDSQVPVSESKQLQEAHGYDLYRRYTLARFDLLIRPDIDKPQQARLLRLSLERAPKGRTRKPPAPHSPGTVFLFMEMSEEHKHIAKSRQYSSPDSTGDSAKSPSLPNLLGVRYQSPNAKMTPGASLEERMDALGRENSALRAQVSTVTEEMKSKVAALASHNTAITSQNAALANQNAALQAQMAAMWQRLDALTAAAATTTSSLPAHADTT